MFSTWFKRLYIFKGKKNHINYKCKTNTTGTLVCNSKSRLTHLNEFLIYVFGHTVHKDAILWYQPLKGEVTEL